MCTETKVKNALAPCHIPEWDVMEGKGAWFAVTGDYLTVVGSYFLLKLFRVFVTVKEPSADADTLM